MNFTLLENMGWSRTERAERAEFRKGIMNDKLSHNTKLVEFQKVESMRRPNDASGTLNFSRNSVVNLIVGLKGRQKTHLFPSINY